METTTPMYSAARRAGDLIYTSGHVGRERDGSPAEGMGRQTTIALEQLEATLRTMGLDRSHIVKATVYVTDLRLRDEMNLAYGEFFEPPFPARATVEVGLPHGLLVEVDAVASASVQEAN